MKIQVSTFWRAAAPGRPRQGSTKDHTEVWPKEGRSMDSTSGVLS